MPAALVLVFVVMLVMAFGFSGIDMQRRRRMRDDPAEPRELEDAPDDDPFTHH